MSEYEIESGGCRRLFSAFKALGNTDREFFLEKVISDPIYRKDLIDIALIEETKKVKGKSISAKDYFAKRRKEVEPS